MWVLVFKKVQNLAVSDPVYTIAQDESCVVQFLQKLFDTLVGIIVGEHLSFDPSGSILQLALAVSQAPQALKKKLCIRAEFGQVFVLEKTRFEFAGSHRRPLSSLFDDRTSKGSGCRSFLHPGARPYMCFSPLPIRTLRLRDGSMVPCQVILNGLHRYSDAVADPERSELTRGYQSQHGYPVNFQLACYGGYAPKLQEFILALLHVAFLPNMPGDILCFTSTMISHVKPTPWATKENVFASVNTIDIKRLHMGRSEAHCLRGEIPFG